jgi:hypothetical protein
MSPFKHDIVIAWRRNINININKYPSMFRFCCFPQSKNETITRFHSDMIDVEKIEVSYSHEEQGIFGGKVSNLECQSDLIREEIFSFVVIM